MAERSVKISMRPKPSTLWAASPSAPIAKMKIIFAIVVLVFTTGCLAHRETDCLITLNKSRFVPGEKIVVAFSTTADTELFERLLMGNGQIQIYHNSKMIYEMKLGPISAPKRENRKLAFYHAVLTDGDLLSFKTTPGEYSLRVKTNDWSSKEVGFKIVRSMIE